MLEGVVRVANRHGFFVKVLGVDAGADAIPRLCIELRLEAVIGIEMDVPGIERMLSELGRHRIPLIVLDRGFEHPKAMSVFSDDAQGMRLVVEHLVGLGHSRIAFVGGDPGAGGAIVRAAGFRAAMTAEGLSVAPDDLRCGYWDDAATESAVRALLGRPDRPTAIVCASDPMAMVAIRVAHQAGLRVPADVSLVGFADLAMARYASPPLTTVAQPFVEMGMAAMRRLHDTITGEGRRAADSGRRMLLPTQLVVRQSSGPVPSQKRAALAP
jgi:DNA-binding LacI/PurR family transcriptional regulator